MMIAANYVVYFGQNEPVGFLVYGGQSYYSDCAPWVTPMDLARGTYKGKKTRSVLRLVHEDNVSDETFVLARENENNRKWYLDHLKV